MSGQTLEAARKTLAEWCPDVVHANGWKATFARACEEIHTPCVVTSHHGGLVCPAGALLDADDGLCRRPAGEHCVACCQRQLPFGSIIGAPVRVLPRGMQVGVGRVMEVIPFVPFMTGPLTTALAVKRRMEAVRAVAQSKAMVVAPSKAIQGALVRNGIPADRTEVVYHGIEPFARLPLPEGLGSRPLRLAYVGRLNRVKGLHVLADAIGRLRTPAAVELHLLGSAHTRSEKRYAQGTTRTIPVSCRVVEHGQLDRSGIAQWLAACDVLVLPSICLEVFGLVILEAFSLGRPVIVSRCGGPEEIVRDGIDGLVVERNDSKALATAIQSLADDPSRIEAMAKNIRPVRNMQEHVAELERVYCVAIERVKGEAGLKTAGGRV